MNELKHEVGKKFIVEVMSISTDTTIPYNVGNEFEAFALCCEETLNSLQPYEEPVVSRWIDGAVQLPWARTEIVFKYPENEGNDNSQTTEKIIVVTPEEFRHYKWMLASDFPEILEPEPVVPEIPKCPVCGAECFVGKYGLLFCTGCSYQVATLEQHNDLCRRLK